jgi:hypothetical protein
LGKTISNQNLIHEGRLNSGNACYQSVQNLLSSHLLSKNIKIKIYKTIILPVALYGCETWYLILMEEHRLKVFENRVLSRICGPNMDEIIGGWRKLHNEKFHNLYFSPYIIKMIKSGHTRWEGRVACMERRGKHIGYWWESQKERDH